MFDHIRRMCQEYESLKELTERLDTYVNGNFTDITCEYDTLCVEQLELMQKYLKVLERRIFLQLMKGVIEHETINI